MEIVNYRKDCVNMFLHIKGPICQRNKGTDEKLESLCLQNENEYSNCECDTFVF